MDVEVQQHIDIRRSRRQLSIPAYCFIAAAIAVSLRIALYDWEILALFRFPNHDIPQGAGLFAANLHSLRLTGELAWWKSNGLNGYAHYYQAFFSPLPPTPSHIVFIAAAQLVLALDFIGIKFSEYQIYLAITYVVLPWLAVACYCWLTSLFVTHRLPVFFAGVVYALSGIGLWEGAWFYFQEPATLNFLLASVIALLQQPTRARAVVFLAAALIQAASLNYWTLYNLFFVALFLGTYFVFYLAQVRAALAALSRVRLTVLPTAVVALLWIAVLGSIAIVQKDRYVRDTSGGGRYDASTAATKLQVYSVPRPVPPLADFLSAPVDRQAYSIDPLGNPIHNARYIGAVTAALGVLAILLKPGRSVVWLAIVATGVAWICTAPILLTWLWARIPMMNSIQHLFYFYPHFLAQIVVLLAAVGLDRLMSIARFARFWRAAAYLIAAVTFADLGLYYRSVSLLDGDLTQKVIWPTMHPMTQEKRAKLTTPLPPLDPTEGFEGGVRENFPLVTWTFPDNVYLLPREMFELSRTGGRGRNLLQAATTGAPIRFAPRDDPAAAVDLPYRAGAWTYNTFGLMMDVPADGWLYLRQIPDPAWQISVDGVRTDSSRGNALTISIPITAGRHYVLMDYRPAARSLYWPAALLLELTIALLFLSVLRYRYPEHRGRNPEHRDVAPVTVVPSSHLK